MLDPITGGFMSPTSALTSNHDILDPIIVNIHNYPHSWVCKYDSNRNSPTTWFDFAGTHCSHCEPEPLNTFKSIEGLLNTEVDDLTLPAYFWERSDVPSPWNI